jgi:hypothetical protein
VQCLCSGGTLSELKGAFVCSKGNQVNVRRPIAACALGFSQCIARVRKNVIEGNLLSPRMSSEIWVPFITWAVVEAEDKALILWANFNAFAEKVFEPLPTRYQRARRL